jgi:small subunit ribosomal protein S19
MAKEFFYRGKNIQEIMKMSIEDFAKLVPARERRKIKRGFTEVEKKLLEDIKSNSKDVRTHARDMVIIPEMVGKTIKVYNGKEWVQVMVDAEMLAHRLGEFALTRKQVRHSAPGIGATRSSASLSVR